MPGLLSMLAADLRRKALWCYDCDSWPALLKVLFTDGTSAMVLYRLMQWARCYRLVPLEMCFNKANAVFNHCIIGRGADFGPGFVLIHSIGIVINGQVRGGSNIHLEHQVTIGAEQRRSPVLGNNVFVGAGARIIGAVTIGDESRIGANAVVVRDVPPYCTVVGVPARVVRRRRPVEPEAAVMPALPSDAEIVGATADTAAATGGTGYHAHPWEPTKA